MGLCIKEACLLCSNGIPPRRDGIENGSDLENVRQLFEMLEISYQSVKSLWFETEDANFLDLRFCYVCDALISCGMDLKKRLRAVKLDLIRNSLLSENMNAALVETESDKLEMTVNERIRGGIWKLVRQCFSRCQVRLETVKVPEPSVSPSQPVTMSRATRRNAMKEVDYTEEVKNSSPIPVPEDSAAYCASLGTNDSDFRDVEEGSTYSEVLSQPQRKKRKIKTCRKKSPIPKIMKEDYEVGFINNEEIKMEVDELPIASAAEVEAVQTNNGDLNEDETLELDSVAENSTPIPPPPVYDCEKCERSFVSAEILELHNHEIHHSEKNPGLTFRCEFCEKGFTVEDCSLDEEWVDGKCFKSFSADVKTQHFYHFFEVCESHSLVCSRLKKLEKRRDMYGDEGDVAAFLEVNHYEDYDEFHTCILCSTTLLENKITRHYKDSHGLDFYYDHRLACAFCQEVYVPEDGNVAVGQVDYKDVNHFKGFVMRHQVCNLIPDHPKLNYSCKHCNQSFTTPYALFAHDIKVHVKNPKFPCEICKIEFVTWSYLAQHVRKCHHLPIRSHCGRCYESFLQRRDYTLHVEAKHANTKQSAEDSRNQGPTRVTRQAAERCASTISKLSKTRSAKIQSKIPDGPIKAVKKKAPILHPIQTSKTKFDCFVCEQHLDSSKLLDLHLREIHDTEPMDDLAFHCKKCDTEFRRSDYKSSGDPLSDTPTYKYPLFKFGQKVVQYSTFSQFCENHARICSAKRKSAPTDEASPLDCSKCHENFSSDNLLATHLRTHYENIFTNCVLCEFMGGEKNMDDHLYFSHKLKRQCNNQFYCRFCWTCYMPQRPELETGRLIPEEIELFKAFAAHHADCKGSKSNPQNKQTSFSCKFCEKTMNHPVKLFRHEICLHTKNYPIYCPQCGVGFPKREVYVIHTAVHKEKKVKCEVCDEAFHFPHQLVEHNALKHATDKPFVCAHCGKCFELKSRLVRHEYSHLTERTLPCPVCHKLFTHHTFLRKHLRAHKMPKITVNEKIPCHLCGKVFSNKRNQRYHILYIHEKRRPKVNVDTPCHICGKIFRNKRNMENHVYCVHQKYKRPHKQKKNKTEASASGN